MDDKTNKSAAEKEIDRLEEIEKFIESMPDYKESRTILLVHKFILEEKIRICDAAIKMINKLTN